jgi:thiamine-monophosphate kinase
VFTVPQTDYEKVRVNPNLSIIGYITDAGEGKHLITRGGNKHALVAQGWNHMKK